MTYCSLIDKPTHPPKVKHISHTNQNFFQIFFQNFTPPLCVWKLGPLHLKTPATF